jgi:uncharacterized protein (TIGR03086 family)
MPRRRPLVDTGGVTQGDVSATSDRRVSELIERGRDREAAVLGGAPAPGSDDDHDPDHGGTPMDPLAQLDELGPLLMQVVGAISPADLDRPTPCSELTVHGVLEHMVTGAAAFAAAYRGEAPPVPDLGDVLAGFGPALQDLAASITAPGALDRTVACPFGDMAGDTFARFVVLDGLVHGWDMATATGQAYEPSEALVASVDEFAHQVLDPLRDGQTFAEAAEPPPAASPIERLAAYTGRRV